MGLSKSSRILILLAIDSAFFLLELVVGYAVHSLALVADSFHMLNDVLSLCVGLWAVRVANQKTSSKMYTYGWQRAETLGALINGVFLVALCLSIFLEAIQRLVEPQEVSNPKLVLIVGCFGLASNVLGLFLFHDHGHSHGGHSHGEEGHSHDELSAAEAGKANGHTHAHGEEHDHEHAAVADESGNVADVLPQNRIGNWPTTQTTPTKAHAKEIRWSVDKDADTEGHVHKTRRASRRHSRSRSRGFGTAEEINIHPASFRSEIIAASRVEEGTDPSDEEAIEENNEDGPTEHSPLLKKKLPPLTANGHKDLHKHHNHAKPAEASSGGGGHGHSHGDLNMKGVFLHVMGDALGNIGVIGSALIIWLTDYSWRFYSDPVISLIITVIILCSAIPLCKAASRILLQAVPAGISIDDIKEDVETLPGVVSCHHLHVWQLSDTKLVASLHVQVEFDFKDEGSARYMQLAFAIRRCLHDYGIHSSTIQPEFCLDRDHDHSEAAQATGHDDADSCDDEHVGGEWQGGSSKRDTVNSKGTGSKTDEDDCLLECGEECGGGKQCCAPAPKDGKDDTKKGDGHGHDHGHSH